MATYVLRLFAAAFVAVVALTGPRVSAQTHHVLAGDVGSWSSGRVFRVGDKISFNSGAEESVVELEGPEEFDSCDLTNPIKMYTDTVTHVELDKEGTRYFTSANPESCKNGLKLPVSVQSHEFWPPTPEYGPPEHAQPPPEYGPPDHAQLPPQYGPPDHAQPPPEHVQPPPEHVQPPPEHFQPPPEYGPPEPVQPPPVFVPPPPPRTPSAANYLNGLSFVLFAGLLVCSIGM